MASTSLKAEGARATPTPRSAPAARGSNALQEQQRLETRKALLAAAVEVFGARGYLDTSVEHVLARANVSRAAFYRQFDSKLALVCALASDFVPNWRPVFDSLMVLDAPSIDDLEQWARLHIAFHRDNQAICGLLTQVAGLEDRLYWQLADQRDALITDLGQRFDTFRQAAENPAMRLRARLLLAQIDEACFLIVRGRIPDPGHHAPRLIAEQIHALLQF